MDARIPCIEIQPVSLQIQQLTEELTKASAAAAKESDVDQQRTQRKMQQLRIQVHKNCIEPPKTMAFQAAIDRKLEFAQTEGYLL